MTRPAGGTGEGQRGPADTRADHDARQDGSCPSGGRQTGADLMARLFDRTVALETHRRGSTLLSRFGGQFAIDAGAWALAVAAAGLLRYEFAVFEIAWPATLALVGALVVLQALLGWLLGLYRGRYVYASFEEVRALVLTILMVAVPAQLLVVVLGHDLGLARSLVVIATPIALVVMFAVRYAKRLYVERGAGPGQRAERALVYGAGYMGQLLVRRMSTDPRSPYLPVGLIDDDPRKRHLLVAGVPVLGRGADLVEVVRSSGAKALVVAITNVDAPFLRAVDEAVGKDVAVKVLPSLDEILTTGPARAEVRDLAVEDLIGRHAVDTDVDAAAGYLDGNRVLITGAGGSIGAEICRQLTRFAPAELIMLDRDESALQAVQLSLRGHGLLDTPEVVLADIRDEDALEAVFRERRPDVVFHAAALKHLPMLEQYPDEAWKTNVLGTVNVLRAAMRADVRTFVNISTDKAADATSVLGHSKRLGEMLTAWAAHRTGRDYRSVRFGNVLGSRGSLLPALRSMIAAGGPVTLTHPDATRYFMTIPEACQLVVQAGAVGAPAQVLVLDMGEPVRIKDIVDRLIADSGRAIDVVVTGLRPGEKLHEELVGQDEVQRPTRHPLIRQTDVPPVAPEDLDHAAWRRLVRSTARQEAGAPR